MHSAIGVLFLSGKTGKPHTNQPQPSKLKSNLSDVHWTWLLIEAVTFIIMVLSINITNAQQRCHMSDSQPISHLKGVYNWHILYEVTSFLTTLILHDILAEKLQIPFLCKMKRPNLSRKRHWPCQTGVRLLQRVGHLTLGCLWPLHTASNRKILKFDLQHWGGWRGWSLNWHGVCCPSRGTRVRSLVIVAHSYNHRAGKAESPRLTG